MMALKFRLKSMNCDNIDSEENIDSVDNIDTKRSATLKDKKLQWLLKCKLIVKQERSGLCYQKMARRVNERIQVFSLPRKNRLKTVFIRK
jgi:hypothetical protein